MRIAIIGPAYPLRGGIAHYVTLLYQKLSRRGHHVFVLSFKRQYPKFLFPGKTQEDSGRELIPLKSSPVLDSIGPISWVKAFFRLKQYRPDMILYKYWMPFFAPCYAAVSWLAKTFLKCRIIYICDNIIPHENSLINRPLTRLGLKFVDGFIVQSRSVQEDLLSFRPDADFSFVPHPVYEIFPDAISKPDARKQLGLKEDKVIVYFGFIRKYKGVRFLIEAMPEILKKENVRLLVCGEFYEGRDDILSLVDRLQVQEAVTIYDHFIPNEEVPLYFCGADIIVLPYVSATQSGIVQIAYHYNKPVIVTRVGGLPEVVLHEKTGYVMPPMDSKALAGAVLAFYQKGNPDRFEKNIRTEKKKYSWDRMCEAIEAFGGL